MNPLHKFFKGLVMTKPQFKSARRVQQRRSGMTLIELLVAISVLVIIAGILVPQLRFASADRNIREASRMLASQFAEASQRAISDGIAGIVIERNPNIVDDITGVAYAGTSMFILREIPRYTGDDAGAMARGITATTAIIPLPLEQEDLNTVRVGDQISFGSQSQSRYLITDLTELGSQLMLTFETSLFGTPPTGVSEFVIHRQPRKLVSSRIDMPTGYLVDLRLSGEVDLATTTTFFAQDPDATSSVSYTFNGRGSVDRFFYTDAGGALVDDLPTQTVYLMVREYSTDDGGELIENVLSSENQMWVTVDPSTGAANVVSGLGVDTSVFTTLSERLAEARKLGSEGQAAQ